jgi:hypothetical protein
LTDSKNGNGTKIATSPGEESVTAAAMPLAKLMASSFVSGLSFQFPVMNGFRVAESCVILEHCCDGAKAKEVSDSLDNSNKVHAQATFMVIARYDFIFVKNW